MVNSNLTLNKVAKVTIIFWILKIIATTLGETLGDHIAHTLELGYAVSLIITAIFFLVVLVVQLGAKEFRPVKYWLVIVATTTLGTEISDFMDRTLGLGYLVGFMILLAVLLAILFLWHRSERNLKVFPIFSLRVQLFFWLAVLASNSLGTAFGDFLIDNLGLTYLQGAMATAGIIALVLALHYLTKINEIVLFWIAFVFTRPFGATFGDLLTKPIDKGGLDLGTLQATLVCIVLMTIVILIFSRNQKQEI